MLLLYGFHHVGFLLLLAALGGGVTVTAMLLSLLYRSSTRQALVLIEAWIAATRFQVTGGH
jgi:hypothetical protein